MLDTSSWRRKQYASQAAVARSIRSASAVYGREARAPSASIARDRAATRSRGATMTDALLRLVEITKLYGRVKAVDGLSLDVREGEVFTLLGPSGCGKTTTLRLI